MSKQSEDNLYRKTSDNISQGSNEFSRKMKNMTTVKPESSVEYENLDDNASNSSTGSTGSGTNFLNSKPKTIFDGAFKGVISLGSGIVNGAKGVITQPIEGAKEGGVGGFFKGVVKGVSGAVILPVVGTFEFLSFSVQGIVNTPLTIIDAMKTAPKEEELKPLSVESRPVFFGVTLEESLLNAKERGVPHLLTLCIEYIEKKKTHEGIFRVNGSAALISELQKSFEKCEFQTLSDLRPEWTYEVCGIFKAYFRYLPESIIPVAQSTELINIHKSTQKIEDKIVPMRSIINSIPDPDYTALYMCTEFLFDISQHSKENLMSPSNLSIIFGVSWIRPSETDIQEIANANTVVFILISNFKSIFTKKPTLSFFSKAQS